MNLVNQTALPGEMWSVSVSIRYTKNWMTEVLLQKGR